MDSSSDAFAFVDLSEGQAIHDEMTFDENRILAFIQLSGDAAPVHTDRGHAREMGFSDRLVHGFFVALPYSRMMGMRLPGSNTVIQKMQVDMVAPVFVGDTLRYSVSVQRIFSAVRAVVLTLEARNQHDTVVSRGTATCIFRR